MANREISDAISEFDERRIVEELDREVNRKDTLFALLACLAVAAGLALSAVLALGTG